VDAGPEVRAALRAHPDVAPFHELLGRVLEQRAAPPTEVRAAYERALEIEPANARALAALARIAAPSDPDRARALVERAIESDPRDPPVRREVALALRAADDLAGAERALEAALAADPLDAASAAELSSLLLARDPASERGLELGRRAARFGPSGEARARVDPSREGGA
jgi:tetratricopeptide (TPR) repeat protein